MGPAILLPYSMYESERTLIIDMIHILISANDFLLKRNEFSEVGIQCPFNGCTKHIVGS